MADAPSTALAPFVDRREAARLMRVSVSFLAHRAGSPDGPPLLRIGRRVLYPVPDLIAWAEGHRIRVHRPPGRPRKR